MFKGKTHAQSVGFSLKTGMSVDEVLSESGEVIPVYINKGYSKKLEFDLWD
jgi:hypothetical protein